MVGGLPDTYRKGIGLIFPNLDTEIGSPLRLGTHVRQRKRSGGRRREPREEFSFLCKEPNPWNRLARR